MLQLFAINKQYGAEVILRDISFTLNPGERPGLIGPNGCGKTTLLRIIAGQLAPLRGRVRLGVGVRLGYYAQEQEGLDPSSTPLATILGVASMPETEARSFLHCFLFSGDDVFIPVGSLSFGERALARYEGTVLAVVHNRYFIERFAGQVWRLAQGTVAVV